MYPNEQCVEQNLCSFSRPKERNKEREGAALETEREKGFRKQRRVGCVCPNEQYVGLEQNLCSFSSPPIAEKQSRSGEADPDAEMIMEEGEIVVSTCGGEDLGCRV